MNSSRKAEWVIFHRLFVYKYNAFIDLCPAGFKHLLDQLDILSCDKTFNRRKMVAFEATEELYRPARISEADAYIISMNRSRVLNFIIKVDSMFPGCRTRPLSQYEAWLLRDWLGVDVGRFIPISYEDAL